MRIAVLLLALMLFGCLEQQCPECKCPDIVQPNITNTSLAEPNCTSANITIINVNQTCNQTIDVNNLSLSELPEPEAKGILFANQSYLLVLDDVSVPTSAKGSCGIFSVKYAGNLSVADRFIVCPGDTQYWVSPEGQSFRIVVVEVAAGYTKDVKWAEVIIYG
jgi:hypothetical protein